MSRINKHNQSATNVQKGIPAHLLPVPYPTQLLEAAVFSENAISVGPQTIQAATEYLLKARELNVLIEALQDTHFSFLGGQAPPANRAPSCQHVYDQAKDVMPDVVQQLGTRLESEVR